MSEEDSGWLLRHRDGVEHGPFQLVDLVSAARAGHVADDTCVRHAVHTKGQWVVAMRLQPIAQGAQIARDAQVGQGAGVAQGTQESQVKRAAQVVTDQPAAPANSPATTARQSREAPSLHPANSAAQPVRSAQPVRTGAPESIFRNARAAVRPTAGTAPHSPANDSPAADSPVPQTPELGLAVAVRTHVDEGIPVPKTFLDAAAAFAADFRFRKFVTPWIIKILWALAYAGALIAMLRLCYDLFIQPSMAAPGPRTEDGQWEFEPLAGQTLFQTRAFAFAVGTAAIGVSLLCLRVVCELIVLIFRVGGDVREFRKQLQQSKS